MNNSDTSSETNVCVRGWQPIFRAISDPAMIVDPDYRIVACNSATAQRLGKTEEEIVGHHCYELFHCAEQAPDGCPHRLLLAAETPQLVEMELAALGGYYHVAVAPILDENGVLVNTLHIAREISEHRIIAEKLRESQVILDNIFSTEHFLFAVLDTAGNYVRVNKAYAAFCQVEPDSLVGKNYFQIFPHPDNKTIFQQVIATGEPYSVFAKPVEHPGQSEQAVGVAYWDWTVSPVRDAAGVVIGLLVGLVDVTEKERAILALRANEEKFRRLVENIGREYIIYSHDINGVFTYVSPSVTNILGYSQQEFLADYTKFLTENPCNQELLAHGELTRSEPGKPFLEMEIRHRNGEVHLLEIVEEPVIDEQGRVVAVEGIAHDVTSMKITMQALMESEELNRVTLAAISDAVFLTRANGDFIYVCPEVGRIFGYSYQETLALGNIAKLFGCIPYSPEELEKSGELSNVPCEVVDKEGTAHSLLVNIKQVAIRGGSVLLTCRDITGLLQARAEVSELEHQWANAMDFIDDAIYLVGPDDRVIMANSVFYRLTRLLPDQTLGHDIGMLLHPSDDKASCPICQARIEGHDLDMILDADHETNRLNRTVQVMVRPIRDKDGLVRNTLVGIRDLSPWEEMRNQLQIFNQLHEAVITTDTRGLVTNWNKGAENLTGYTLQEALGKNINMFFLVQKLPGYPEGREVVLAGEQELEVWVLQKYGKLVPTLISSSHLKKQSGESIGTIYCLMDISERKIAEERLRQSQKMEAIGNLAGGIAHDFNNILSPVFGYTELTMSRLPPGSEERKYLAEVVTAARRAKDLVRQILAFSRKSEQEKRPTPVHVMVKESLKLLRASLPATIEIQQNLVAREDLVMCEPTQIHQIMMNLCTNALHAMQ